MWLLVFCVSSSLWHGLACRVWLWHFLVIPTNFLKVTYMELILLLLSISCHLLLPTLHILYLNISELWVWWCRLACSVWLWHFLVILTYILKVTYIELTLLLLFISGLTFFCHLTYFVSVSIKNGRGDAASPVVCDCGISWSYSLFKSHLHGNLNIRTNFFCLLLLPTLHILYLYISEQWTWWCGLARSMWLWHFLVILIYFLKVTYMELTLPLLSISGYIVKMGILGQKSLI